MTGHAASSFEDCDGPWTRTFDPRQSQRPRHTSCNVLVSTDVIARGNLTAFALDRRE